MTTEQLLGGRIGQSTIGQPPAGPKVINASHNDASRSVLLFVLVVAILYFGKEVLLPITLALLLAFILAPLVDLFNRLRLGRAPSVILAVMLALGLIVSIGTVIGGQLAQVSSNIPRYVTTVEIKFQHLKSETVGQLSKFTDKIGHHDAAQPGQDIVANGAGSTTTVTQAPSREENRSPLKLIETYLAPVLAPLATLGIVVVITIFALLQREDLRDRLIRLIGSNDLHRTTLAMDDGARRLSKYFLVQLIINSAFGLVIGIGLLVIGIPNPVLWGILSALLRFVPYVGSFISAVLPIAMAAAIAPGWSLVVYTSIFYLVAETITGQVIEPLVYGHNTGLSPFSVVVAAIFWSWVWGPVGLILSTPLTLCLVVLGKHIQRLEFLNIMLGDQPVLTPVESFYQRILAKDADEVQEQAELILKDHSLTAYYDDVAMQGLQLAVTDARRGVLTSEQVDAIRETVQELVDGLAKHQDIVPPSDHHDTAIDSLSETADHVSKNQPPPHLQSGDAHEKGPGVLCIAGRGPLDEAASAMLGQILTKHGFAAEAIKHRAVSRGAIDTLDVAGVSMICVSYLDLSGSPAHLRYLVQRLRRRVGPDVPIIVGLWPEHDTILRDDERRQDLGADFLGASFAKVVTFCVNYVQQSGRNREAA